MKKRQKGGNQLSVVSEVNESKRGTGTEVKKSEEDDDVTSKLSGFSGTNTQSNVYEIINRAVNKEKLTIHFPTGFKARALYIFSIPLTHL